MQTHPLFAVAALAAVGIASLSPEQASARPDPPLPDLARESVLVRGQGKTGAAADQPQPRTDANSKLAHEQMLANLKKGRIDVYFSGDSITRRWRATDYPQFLAKRKKK